MLIFLPAALLVMLTGILLISPYPFLAPAPAAALLGGLVLFRRPAWALYSIIFMIPFGSYRKLAGGALDLPWLLAGFLLAFLILHMARTHKVPGFVTSPVWPLFALYVGWSTLSILFSPFAAQITDELTTMSAAVAFVVLVVAFTSREDLLRALPLVVTISISLGSMLGLVGYVLGMEAFSTDSPTGTSYRAEGGAIDPNNQAVMTLFVLPIIAHLAVYAKTWRERLIMSALFVLNVFGVVMTMSRSGFVACVITIIALAFHYRHRLFTVQRLKVLLAATVVGGVTFVVVVPDSFFERQSSLFEWEDRSLSRRTTYLSVAADAIQERPVIGWGPKTFRELYSMSDVARQFSEHPKRWRRMAHNSYLEVLVGSGIIGLAAYVSILFVTLRHLRSAERAFAANDEESSADLTACFRIGLLVLLLFLVTFSEVYHKYLLLAIGLSIVALRVSGAATGTPPVPKAPPVLKPFGRTLPNPGFSRR